MFINKNLASLENHRHGCRDLGKLTLRFLSRLKGPQGHKPVKRPTLQVVEAKRFGHPARHRTLARGRRPVDRDDRHAHDRIFLQESKNPGKVFATQPGSLIVTGTPPSAASEKLIAMRWSS